MWGVMNFKNYNIPNKYHPGTLLKIQLVSENQKILVFALVILSGLWQNTPVPRWLSILIAVSIGVILGLIYGWKIDPIQYTDITPEVLRVDYRTDYVLMVAEAYHNEKQPELASKRLAVLGSKPPAVIAEEAYKYAKQTTYSAEDLALIQDLVVALQTWKPIPGTNLP